MTTTTFRIRDAAPSPTDTDAHFITAAFDSCIPHLSSIGSATQWGTAPLSTSRPGFSARYVTAIADAEKYRLSTTTAANPPLGDSASDSGDSGSSPAIVRVLIAEAVLPDGGHLPVGAATLRGGYLPKYVLEQKHLAGVTGRLLAGEEGPFMFLETLVTDFSEATKAYRKGAGAALVEYAREWVRGLGMGCMYVDCWAGNGGKLVGFYEAQGFEKVDAFVAEKPDGVGWPGMFLRMDVAKKDSQ
ncbi:uncharacterized protein B0H64DRAFT_102678 [Chaetomium fimeti]|uniref:N-acetyltransferase domain-containing protein n=1 Tax=Chaetomium fimeti TaxID=1854472 RepID=A0AAE0HNR3_9PEZI|nr:hypothetical protein B0H64DRAFT_102678 [Chaetomium fimeti]